MGVFLRGSTWWIDFYADGRRIREKIGPDKKLAELVLMKRTVAIAEGKFLDVKPKAKKIKLFDFIEKYLEYAQINKKSWKGDFHILNTVKRIVGNKNLDDISSWNIERYKIERRKESGPATVNRGLSCLKTMFNLAIKWEYTQTNPVIGVKFLREPNPRVRFLSEDEVVSLLSECCTHLKSIVICALHTGMRKGEVLNLKWENVNFVNRILIVEESKNGERRDIPISDTLWNELMLVKMRSKSPYVFTDNEGKGLKEIKTGFKAALKRAGIEDFRFHDLRHTFASYLVMKGVDLNTVRELLGHKSLEMTLRYSHLSKGHKNRAILVLDEIPLKPGLGHKLVTKLNIIK